MDKIKVAVIGYGHLGKWHCDKVETSGLAKLCYIVEPLEENAVVAQAKFPLVKVVKSLEQCIHEIDAGVVVTPTIYHATIVEQLLKYKKHVFCEKPVTSTYEEIQHLQKIVDNSLVFQVGHSERFHRLWEEAKDIYSPFLENCHIEINRYAPFKGRATDVDVVQDLMIHDIDLLFYLLDKYPQRSYARGFKIRTDKWDSVSSFFHFADNCSALINVGRNHCQERREMTISNSYGTCHIDFMRETIETATGSTTKIDKFEFQARDHLQVEHNFFYESIRETKPPVVSFAAGARAVDVVNGVLKSIDLWPEAYCYEAK